MIDHALLLIAWKDKPIRKQHSSNTNANTTNTTATTTAAAATTTTPC